MLDDLHIIDFCNDVGRILTMLHRLFPREQEVYVGDLIGFEEPDEYGLYSKRHESCLSTLIWLKTEGWIRFASLVRREAVDQCVLTQRAFVHLHRALHPSLQPSLSSLIEASPPDKRLTLETSTIIDALHLATKTHDSTALRALVMHLLSMHLLTQGEG